MAKERYNLIIMVEKTIYDYNDEAHPMGPINGEYQVVPGQFNTLKLAREAAEQLATSQIKSDATKQESSLPSEGELPGESDHHGQHRSRDGSRI
jgi:hypothetical protein